MPNSRKEFEINMHFLSEALERGSVGITRTSVRSIKGLKSARFAPNGRANLHTVDEIARLMANMLASMINEKKLKQEDHEQD